jgi:hypothetical protein
VGQQHNAIINLVEVHIFLSRQHSKLRFVRQTKSLEPTNHLLGVYILIQFSFLCILDIIKYIPVNFCYPNKPPRHIAVRAIRKYVKMRFAIFYLQTKHNIICQILFLVTYRYYLFF